MATTYSFTKLRGNWFTLRQKFAELFDDTTGHDHDGANSKSVSVGTPGDGTVTNAKLATAVKVGALTSLTTTEKASVVGAINEVDANADTAQSTATAKYTKPGGGIPQSDLDAATQAKVDGIGNAATMESAGNIILTKKVTLNGVNPTSLNFLGANTAATITGTAATPFALAHNDTLIINPDGAGDETVTFLATAGTSTGAAGASEDMSADLDTQFQIAVDGGAAQTATCVWAGCVTGAAIATQMQTVIQALGGAFASVTVAFSVNKYIITSALLGTSSAVVITPATTLNATEELKIGVAAGGTEAAGTGGVTGSTALIANIAATTAAEAAAALNVISTGWTASVNGTRVEIASATTGATSSLAVNAASTADTKFGITGTARGKIGMGATANMTDSDYFAVATLNGVAAASLGALNLSVTTRTTSGFAIECETTASTADVDVIVIGNPA